MIDSKRKLPKYTSDAFGNVEYELRITYTLETDRRVMSFVDTLWGIEVSGGVDQFEPLTIINLRPSGLARRAGMRIGDEITQINDTPALELTFNEALDLFRSSGRYVRVYVRGEVDDDGEEDWTCDYWFRPRIPWRRDFKPIQFEFPWNDRRKPIYKESNCFMVPSRMEEKIRLRRAATSAVKKKEELAPHTRSLTPSPRPKNQPGPNLFDDKLKARNLLP
uniref:PDZ domain-containing protein n=1 Tax=Glossina morsitans morsitans TaxID=37546 RepID=A0A1B0FEY1_GLOMM